MARSKSIKFYGLYRMSLSGRRLFQLYALNVLSQWT